MKPRDDFRVWLVVGALGSMALGVALMPLRSFTSASNLAFVFLAFTILVAERGGRVAALTTALISAMTLNFCLTEPYLTLNIDKRDDLVAFFALAACGLIAAAFGKRREALSEVVDRAGKEADVLKRLVESLRKEASLEEILRDLRNSFGLQAIALRDAGEKILAVSPEGSTPRAIPEMQLNPGTLFPSDETQLRFGVNGLRLPERGGRLNLKTGEQGFLSLDLWEGDTQGFATDQWRTLGIAVTILGLELSRRYAK